MNEEKTAGACCDSQNAQSGEGPLRSAFDKLRREFDHWTEAALEQGERALGAVGIAARHWTPTVDIIETPHQVRVTIDVPGLEHDQVEVSLAGNMLTVRGERPESTPGEGETAHLRERGRGKFSRAIPMPAPVEAEGVSAEVHNGVLNVVLNKSPQAVARQIHVTASRRHTKHAAE